MKVTLSESFQAAFKTLYWFPGLFGLGFVWTGEKGSIKKKEFQCSRAPTLDNEGETGLTLKEHCLAEVTAHVIPTHSLDAEQVKAIRWDMANGGFL